MLETQMRTIFPQLPFDTDIQYFEIKTPISFQQIENIPNETSTAQINQKESDFPRKSPLSIPHKTKCHVKMNESASIFKFSFYQIFTSRKKFPKKYVIMIHNSICPILKLRNISRDESRSIDLYFANFAQYSEKILLFIKNNKNSIIQKIPELKGIMNLYI